MAVISSKRSIMTLYSLPLDVYSHRVRIALAEKGVAVDIINVNPERLPEDFIELNPYNTLPTLVDRDLVLYEPNIIIEYLDERFPHPPLLPVYPVSRAKSRLMIHRIDQDWYSLMHGIEQATDEAGADSQRQRLAESISSIAPVFASQPFFLSDEFSLVDCCLAPLFWRFPHFDIKLTGKAAKIIDEYSQRIFSRDTFKASLTEPETDLRGYQEAF